MLATQRRIAWCTRVRAPAALQAPWECLPKLSSGTPHNCPLCAPVRGASAGASRRDSRQAESVEKGLLEMMVVVRCALCAVRCALCAVQGARCAVRGARCALCAVFNGVL